jgi:uncharacterized protein YoxC
MVIDYSETLHRIEQHMDNIASYLCEMSEQLKRINEQLELLLKTRSMR